MGLSPMEELLETMRTLRGEGGCPWDREQTLESLKPYLVEETYEVIDAIESGDRNALKEELGDLLLQIVFQAQICAEEGSFTFQEVPAVLVEKLVRRHPHVFGDREVADSDEVIQNWNAIKKEEKKGKAKRESVIGDIPRHLPALQKADHVQRRAAQVGFDWDEVHSVVMKLEEEVAEVKEALKEADVDAVKDEIGDLLFAVVNLGRFLGHNSEELLNQNVSKFVRRFHSVEEKAHERAIDMKSCTLEELDALWDEVKAEESGASLDAAGR